MYYKYKPRKKDHTLIKRLIISGIIVVIGYSIYAHRDILMFWKMDQNKLYKSIKSAVEIKDAKVKESVFVQLKGEVEAYVASNPLDSDAFFMSSVFNYELFKLRSGMDFSEVYFHGTSSLRRYTDLLYRIQKDIKKAISLSPKSDPGDDFRVILAKCSYYTSFDRIDYIYELLKKINTENSLLTADDIRFISTVFISYGEYEQGLELLKSKGDVEKDSRGKIFYAKALGDAKKYTEAIVVLREILGKVTDNSEKVLVFETLGRIYMNQHLFREAAEQFEKVREIEPKNVDICILLGKSYQEQGYKDKAGEVWAEAYKIAPDNDEIAKLMGQ